MLTQSFLPTQRALARQAVVRAAATPAAAAATAPARGDVKHHLLQVHHRLAEEAEGLQVAPRRLLVAEARLALAADQLVLHLWNNEGVVEGVRTFAFCFWLFGGFRQEGGHLAGCIFLLFWFGGFFGRVFVRGGSPLGGWGLACFGRLRFLLLESLLLERLLQALLVLLVLLQEGARGQPHEGLRQRGAVGEQAFHAVHGLQVTALQGAGDLGGVVGGEAWYEVRKELAREQRCGVRSQGRLQRLQLGRVHCILHGGQRGCERGCSRRGGLSFLLLGDRKGLPFPFVCLFLLFYLLTVSVLAWL